MKRRLAALTEAIAQEEGRLARLDTLFLALPFSWKGMLVQYTGRLHRLHPGKEEVRVYDYLDGAVPMLAKMHDKRMKGFKAMGYERAAQETI